MAGQQMLDDLGVNIDSGYSRIDGGGSQVKQTRSTGADQNDPALNLFLRNLAGEHLPGGDIGRLIEVPEFEVHASRIIGGYFDFPDLNVVEACGLAEGRLATGVGRLKHEAACALGDAKGLSPKRRHEILIEPEQESNPANDLIAISDPVKGANTVCGLLELWKVLASRLECQ